MQHLDLSWATVLGRWGSDTAGYAKLMTKISMAAATGNGLVSLDLSGNNIGRTCRKITKADLKAAEERRRRSLPADAEAGGADAGGRRGATAEEAGSEAAAATSAGNTSGGSKNSAVGRWQQKPTMSPLPSKTALKDKYKVDANEFEVGKRRWTVDTEPLRQLAAAIR